VIKNEIGSANLSPPGKPTLSSDGKELNALVRLYLESQPALRRFLISRTGSEQDAAEILQEIYFRIHALPVTAEIQQPLAYLYRIGSNLWLDRLRQRRRSAIREREWTDTHTSQIGDMAISEVAPMEAHIDGQRALAALLADMSTLTPQCHRAFHLHKFEGMSHAEVAKVMGISRSAVEKHISNALRRLLPKRRI
jgi:RNA polymerase sigma factor (sigma-70 family)